ncbi:MAG: glycine--tRNA ligase subunit beta [Alphaproteobacteria bacterium]
MAELLIELLSEEIPARMQDRAAGTFRTLVLDELAAAGLAPADPARAEALVTPRRLALVVPDLPLRQADQVIERKGPRPDSPARAIEGFLKSAGLDSIDEAELRETDKGMFYFSSRHVAGERAEKVLPGLVGAAIGGLGWPKSMRWGETDFAWVRPLLSVLALFDGKVLKGAVDLGGAAIEFTGRTSGHRFLAPGPVRVRNFRDYGEKLHNAFVMLDGKERRDFIRQSAEALARHHGLRLGAEGGLLDEVAGLVEWPVVRMGRIDSAFMDLPPEVLVTAMSKHQRYFALHTGTSRLADRFLLVSNMETDDDGAAIIAGNERVLRARLSDAKFFWDQDRRQTLASRAARLKEITFHSRLGTLDDKADRVQALAVAIARHVPGADGDRVRSAARLAKCDLTSGMVGEFPELQGVMGRYYALGDGEHAEVADAIRDHYAPQGPGDACPAAPVTVALALADKIDTLAGFFAIDEKPTGSKDPYALRRAALGVIRLILENGLRLPLDPVFGAAGASRDVASDLLGFIADRLKTGLREQGVRHDLIAAAFAARKTATDGVGAEDDLVRLLARVAALEAFLDSEAGGNLLIAYRRAMNIVRAETAKGGFTPGPVSADLLREPAERAAFEAVTAIRQPVRRALEKEDFEAAMGHLASLRPVLDVLFDEVTINATDAGLRENRLRLLSEVGGAIEEVADFSRVEGESAGSESNTGQGKRGQG